MSENNFICIKINIWLSRALSALLFITGSYRSNFSTADSLPINRRFRQHSFLSSISYRSTFQQLIFRNQTEFPPAFFFIIGSYRPTSDQLVPRCNRASASTFVNRPIGQIFWSYGGFFDDFHIEGYFHFFSFMGWILNFISIHSINWMNKWSILIIYSFMK